MYNFCLTIHVKKKYVSLCYADLYGPFDRIVCSTSFASSTHYLETSSFDIIISWGALAASSILAGSSGWCSELCSWCSFSGSLAPTATSYSYVSWGNFQK